MTIPRPFALVGFALPWVGMTFTLGWLFFQRFPLDGQFVATTVFDGTSAFIHQPLPAERFFQRMVVDDPVYINARIPGIYERVEVRIEFRPTNQPLLEFGLVRDAAGQQLDLQPLYSQQLEDEKWKNVDGGYAWQGTSFDVFRRTPIDRLFSWKSQDQRFADLNPKRFTVETDLIRENAIGVLTPYQRPRELEDGWREGILSFSFPSSRDQLRFIVSAPEIQDRQGQVGLRRMTLVYKRQPLSFEKFKEVFLQELKNAYRRLKPKLWK